MGKFFLFIWRWVLPFIGIAAVAAIVGSVYVYFSYMRSIEEFAEIEPERKQTDVRIASPDNSREIVFVRYKKDKPSDPFAILFASHASPYADGFVYVVETGKEISWLGDDYEIEFNEKYKDGNNENRYIHGRWATDNRIVIEYCGVSVEGVYNETWIAGEYLEIELHRSVECPVNVKIGKEPLAE